MSWSITIKGDGLPDPQEPVVSICSCPGSLVELPTMFGMDKLCRLSRPDQIKALELIIEECDKNNCGSFDDAFATHVDMAWSKGEETKREYERFKEHLHLFRNLFVDLHTFRGHTYRTRTRELAMRFYLYLKAGYDIDFEW